MCLHRIYNIGLLYSVNSFWIVLKQITLKKKKKLNEWQSLFLSFKPSVCSLISPVLAIENNYTDTCGHACLCDVAWTSYWSLARCYGCSPLMVWKTNIWWNALESFSAGFCSLWTVAVGTLFHFSPAGFWNTIYIGVSQNELLSIVYIVDKLYHFCASSRYSYIPNMKYLSYQALFMNDPEVADRLRCTKNTPKPWQKMGFYEIICEDMINLNEN